MSCLVCFSSRLQRYSAFITFPFSDIVQGWHFSWMLFMSSKHQPPTVMSHCQPSLHTLLKASTFGCLFDQSRDSQQKQPLWCVLWKPFLWVKNKRSPWSWAIKGADEPQGLTGKWIHGDKWPWQIDRGPESLITQPCLFGHFDYEQSILSTDLTSHKSGKETEPLTNWLECCEMGHMGDSWFLRWCWD